MVNLKVDDPNSVIFVIQPLNLHGEWFGAALRMDTKDTCLNNVGLHAQIVITILVLIVNISRGHGTCMTS